MDKYEYTIKTEKIKKLAAKGEYSTVTRIADGIDWDKVTDTHLLQTVSEAYEAAGRYKKAREILLDVYDQVKPGRRLIFKLTELSAKCGEMKDAEEFYGDYVKIAPNDSDSDILRYELAKAKGLKPSRLIAILESYRAKEFDEKWSYELASLYEKTGRTQDCIRLCDDIILWFGEGEYVDRARVLRHRNGAPDNELTEAASDSASAPEKQDNDAKIEWTAAAEAEQESLQENLQSHVTDLMEDADASTFSDETFDADGFAENLGKTKEIELHPIPQETRKLEDLKDLMNGSDGVTELDLEAIAQLAQEEHIAAQKDEAMIRRLSPDWEQENGLKQDMSATRKLPEEKSEEKPEEKEAAAETAAFTEVLLSEGPKEEKEASAPQHPRRRIGRLHVAKMRQEAQAAAARSEAFAAAASETEGTENKDREETSKESSGTLQESRTEKVSAGTAEGSGDLRRNILAEMDSLNAELNASLDSLLKEAESLLNPDSGAKTADEAEQPAAKEEPSASAADAAKQSADLSEKDSKTVSGNAKDMPGSGSALEELIQSMEQEAAKPPLPAAEAEHEDELLTAIREAEAQTGTLKPDASHSVDPCAQRPRLVAGDAVAVRLQEEENNKLQAEQEEEEARRKTEENKNSEAHLAEGLRQKELLAEKERRIQEARREEEARQNAIEEEKRKEKERREREAQEAAAALRQKERLEAAARRTPRCAYLEASDPARSLERARAAFRKMHERLGTRGTEGALIRADKLNVRGIRITLRRLEGRDLLVAGAADLEPSVLNELQEELENQEEGGVILLMDTAARVRPLSQQYPELRRLCSYIREGKKTGTAEEKTNASALPAENTPEKAEEPEPEQNRSADTSSSEGAAGRTNPALHSQEEQNTPVSSTDLTFKPQEEAVLPESGADLTTGMPEDTTLSESSVHSGSEDSEAPALSKDGGNSGSEGSEAPALTESSVHSGSEGSEAPSLTESGEDSGSEDSEAPILSENSEDSILEAEESQPKEEPSDLSQTRSRKDRRNAPLTMAEAMGSSRERALRKNASAEYKNTSFGSLFSTMSETEEKSKEPQPSQNREDGSRQQEENVQKLTNPSNLSLGRRRRTDAAQTRKQQTAEGPGMSMRDFARAVEDYAKQMECVLDDKAALAVYASAERLMEAGKVLSTELAKNVTDEAIARAEKLSLRAVFSSKYNKEGMLILREQHFLQQ